MLSAERFDQLENLFQCPLCKSSMHVVALKSFVCSNNHTFDIAKQGYVNFTTRPPNSTYKKELFEARRKMIMETLLYNKMHKLIREVIVGHLDIVSSPLVMLDVGCGEGSHLQKIMEVINSTNIGIGIDISKEGIVLAARDYHHTLWIVGDLANSPFRDQSFSVILNIFSPSNYKEFNRLLKQDGIVVKVVPSTHYLKEVREAFYNDLEKRHYQNDQTISLFLKHFHLIHRLKVYETRDLGSAALTSLVQMSPLTWHSTKEQIHSFINQTPAQVTVDLDILVGIKR